MDIQTNDDKGILDNNTNPIARYITELKTRVFGVLFVLLKDNDTQIYVAIFICAIEFIQAISLIFHEEFSSLWGSPDIYKVVSQGLAFTRLIPYIKDTTFTLYSTIFYLLLVLIFLVIADACYLSYIYEKKKSPFSWTVSLLRMLVILLNSVLFLPFFEYFLSSFSCTKLPDGKSYLTMFPTEQCGTGLQLVNSILAGFSCVLLFVVTALATVTLFEARNIANKPNSRVTARANLLFNSYKLLIVVLLTFLKGSDYTLVHIFVIMVGSTLIFMLIQFDNPFYNIVMAKVWSTAAAVNLWSATMLIFAQVMQDTSFQQVMLTWIVGLPLVLGVALQTNDKRMETLLVNVNLFSNGKEIINQVTYLLKLLESQGRDHNSAVMLDGYLEVHKQDCSDVNCPLKRKNRTLSDNKIARNLLSNNANLSEKEAIIIYIVYQIYIEGLIKFSSDTTLHISYAFFLLDIMHSKQQALQELTEAELKKPALDEQFIIFRYKKIIEDEIAEVQNEQNKGGLDVVDELTFQSHLRICQTNIENTSLLHLEFWSQLSEDQPDLAKLGDLGSKINLSVRSVEEHWGKLMKINPNNTKMIRLFGKFLIEVLHDRERGEELLEKVRKITNKNKSKKNAGFIPTDGSADEGTPLIVISGEKDKFALISNINLAAASLFGFSKNEVINRKVNTLMPPIYAKYHDSFISNYLAKNESAIIGNNKERLVLGKNKANYVFPFYYSLKAIPSIIQGIQFISTLRLDKNLKNTAYVLTNAEGVVDSISSSCISLLKMDIKQILQKHIKIQDCVPNIITEKEQLFGANKSHPHLTFNYPKGSPYLEENEAKSIKLSCNLAELVSNVTKETFGFQFMFDKGSELTRIGGTGPQDAQITNFQFRFEKNKANIIGEFADEKASEEDTTKTEDQLKPDGPIEDDSEIKIQIPGMQGQYGQSQKEQEREQEVEFKRVDYGIGVKTLRLMNGAIGEIVEEDKSEEGSEDGEKEKPIGGFKKGFGLLGSGAQEADIEEGSQADFGNSMKSKKVLNSVMNDRSLPPNLKNLKTLGAVLTVVLIGISIFDYVNITTKATDIDSNLGNLDVSHRLIANMMITLSGIQNLYLLGKNAIVEDETALRKGMKEALNAAKLLKENLEVDEKQLSDNHLSLMNNPVVRLSTFDGDYVYKGLTQASEDIITKGLNMVNADLGSMTPSNPDYYFLTVNMLNNYYSALVESSEYYAQELVKRTTSNSSTFVMVFVLSIVVLVLSFLIVIPLIYSITKSRDHILSLFFDIPTKTVKLLYSQCENFVINLQVGEDDDMTSEIDEQEAERINEENETSEWMPRQKRRKFKNTGKNKQNFFINFFVMFCLLEAVFIYNFTTSNNLLSSVAAITTEFNSTSLAESFYSFSNNAQRQLFIDSNMQILNQNPEDIVANNIVLMQNLDSQILNENSMNIKSHTDEYNDIFKKVMYQNSCSLVSEVVLDTCETFADKTVTKGMTVAIVRHFENMRILLKAYDNVNKTGTWPFNSSYLSPPLDIDISKNMLLSLFRVPYAEEVAEMQDIYIRSNYRRLLEQFKVSLGEEFDSLTSLRLFMFILFIFEALILYLFLWIPLVSILNDKLWKTKMMLKMIPISVLVKIKNIRIYLRNFLNENHLHEY